MKKLFLILLIACAAMAGSIGDWDTTGLVFAITPSAMRNHNPRLAAFNSGTAYPVQGPLSGDSITATLTNMTSGYGYVPRHGGAVRLDGVDDYISLNHTLQLTNTSEFTCEAWIFWVAGTANSAIYANDNSGGDKIAIAIKNDYLYIEFYDGTYDTKQSASTLGTGWHHTAIVKDGAEYVVYVDGDDVSSGAGTYNSGDVTLDGTCKIGEYVSTWEFNGRIATTSWYQDALTPSRIAANYALGRHMDGLRGIPSGNNLSIYNPADSVPAAPIGSAFSLANATHVIPIRLRRELSSAKITAPVLPINLGKIMKDDTELYAGIDATCSNLALSNSAGSEIPIDISGYSKTDTTGALWVRVPAADSAADSVYYLNIGTSLTRSVEDSTVYDDTWGGTIDYISFHHLDGAGNPVDATGHWNALSNTAADSATGIIKYGYNFTSGTSNIGDITSLNGATQLTLICWLKTVAEAGTPKLLQKYNSVSNDTFSVYRNSDDIIFRNEAGTGSGGYATFSPLIFNDIWNSVAWVYNGDGATNPDKLKGFNNAVSQSLTFSANFGDLSAIVNTAGYNMIYGGMDGEYDEMRFFSGALTANDISLIYNAEDTYVANAGWDVGGYSIIIRNSATADNPFNSFARPIYRNNAYRTGWARPVYSK